MTAGPRQTEIWTPNEQGDGAWVQAGRRRLSSSSTPRATSRRAISMESQMNAKTLILAAGVLFLAIMFTFTLADYWTRGLMPT